MPTTDCLVLPLIDKICGILLESYYEADQMHFNSSHTLLTKITRYK